MLRIKPAPLVTVRLHGRHALAYRSVEPAMDIASSGQLLYSNRSLLKG